MKRILSTITMSLILTCAFGQTTFTLDGIKYITTTSNTVKVTSGGTYVGAISIPSTVSYSDVIYDVTSIGDMAFSNCLNLTQINLPNSISSIGELAFGNCQKLTSITIPSSISSIKMGTFVECISLTTITIPTSVTSIGVSAFDGCSGLTFISIPNAVDSIGEDAFKSCSGLKSIICNAMIPPTIFTIYPTAKNSFGDVSQDLSLYVPTSSSNAYESATGWKNFTNIIEFSTSGNIISTDSAYVTTGKSISIPIKTSAIPLSRSVVAYQFKMSFDTTKLEYIDYSKESTLSKNGTVVINQLEKGKLNVGYIGTESLSGLGILLNLNFKAINEGEVTPILSDFLINTDTVSTISHGTISIITRYGDVDGNNAIQAYDAALALQNSVGLDPIPSVDPIPWSSWRIVAADVDNNGSITANDAGLILQKSIGVISTFPIENTTSSMLRSASMVSSPDVTITLINNNLVFKSYGNLIGLNVKIYGANGFLDNPRVLNNEMISAVNRNDETYSVGLATAISPEDGSTFMTIPVNNLSFVELRFELVINTSEKNVRMNIPTSTKSLINSGITVYSDFDRTIHVSNVRGKSIAIFDAFGRKVFEKRDLQDSEVFQVNSPGLYFVTVGNQTTKIMVK